MTIQNIQYGFVCVQWYVQYITDDLTYISLETKNMLQPTYFVSDIPMNQNYNNRFFFFIPQQQIKTSFLEKVRELFRSRPLRNF